MHPFLWIFVSSFYNFMAFATTQKALFTNQWIVEINGNLYEADKIAKYYGFTNFGQVFPGENMYLFSLPRVRKRSTRRSHVHHRNIISNKKVKWAEQQQIKLRFKRDLDSTLHFDPQTTPNDPEWPKMWYLHSATLPSMHIMETWKAGYTGKNSTVCILDDGLEHKHPDLIANYDAFSSWDFNNNDSDSTPRYTKDNENQHGTRCAGVIVAAANNKICSLGIAYNAKVGGVRMLDGDITDLVEALSLSYKSDYVDIYSVAWGPEDNGATVEGPGILTQKALALGAKNGRGGKGSIFVWASGNGGHTGDSCNCDGYTSSIYTISVSSTTRSRSVPYYSELCSSTMAATYSSGSGGKIVTTDLRSTCTTGFTGTSVSAPSAAAICALALEANSKLTWRDMQHLVVQTAQPDLNANDWVINGANRKVSHAFGFGLMDALAMVNKAVNWTSVPTPRRYVRTVVHDDHRPRRIRPNSLYVIPVEIYFDEESDYVIDRLEHVQVVLTLHNRRRGDLALYLTSPMGTKSELLKPRLADKGNAGFDRWAFMTVHSWDEDPKGIWMLEIQHDGGKNSSAELSFYSLVLYGTKQSDWPEHLRISHLNKTDFIEVDSNKQTLSSTMFLPTQRIQKLGEITTDSLQEDSLNAAKILKDAMCKVAIHPTAGCSLCQSNFVLDPTTHQCLISCEDGYYKSMEKITFDDPEFDLVETEGAVCRPCPSLCHSCSPVPPHLCTRCSSESRPGDLDLSCVTIDNKDSTPSTRFGVFYIVFLVVSCVIFIFAFVYFYFRSKFKSKTTILPYVAYQHLPKPGGRLSESSFSDSDSDEITMLGPYFDDFKEDSQVNNVKS